jgi:hypothetical protein
MHIMALVMTVVMVLHVRGKQKTGCGRGKGKVAD